MNPFKRLWGTKPPQEKRSRKYPGSVVPVGGVLTSSGIKISADSAMRISTVYTSIKILSESVGVLPLQHFRFVGGGGKEQLQDNTSILLNTRPNSYMTGYDLKKVIILHLCLRGNAFIRIQRGNNGKPKALYPLHPDGVEIKYSDTGEHYYEYQTTGRVLKYAPSDILHFKILTQDGLHGLSPIQQNMELLGHHKATQQYGSEFFANGAQPSGVLEVDDILDDETRDSLILGWRAAHGQGSAHGTALLESGVHYKPIGIAPNHAQFLETMRYTRTDIAAIFGVPPHRVGDLDNANYSNISEQNRAFAQSTIVPLCEALEAVCNVQLVDSQNLGREFWKFDLTELLRGTPAERAEMYNKLWYIGALSANEVRAQEGLAPLSAAHGNDYYVPLSSANPEDKPASGIRPEPRMVTLEQRANSTQSRAKLIKTYEHILADAFRRVIKRDSQQIEARAKKMNKAQFTKWLQDEFATEVKYCTQQLQPPLKSMGEGLSTVFEKELRDEITLDLAEWIEGYTEILARDHARLTAEQISQLVENETAWQEAVSSRLEEWENGVTNTSNPRHVKLAEKEARHYSNKLALAVYASAGVVYLISQANGDSCPLCAELDGQIVGIDKGFGDSGSIAPYHSGCACTIHPYYKD